MKLCSHLSILCMASSGLTLCAADAIGSPQTVPANSQSLIQSLGAVALFAAGGVILLIIGFKAFDKAVTQVDLEQEIRKGNTAAAVLAGSLIVALGLIIAAAIRG